MAKVFRSWDVDQGWLLPPSLHEFVPPGHMAHFVRDTVREALDLSAILDTYSEERGYPPYHPGMMVALLLYGYSRGLYSSHQLARACEERVDVMAVTGLNRPDFRTIADFRKRHLVALSDLFVQVLRLCRAAGLVQFAHVAVDGTKVKANASRHKAMSYGRMKTAEPALAAEVDAWLEQAREADAAEDAVQGATRRGDETPDWMADKQRRLDTIRAAKAALEAEAIDPPALEDESGPGASSGMRWQGRPLRGEDGGPPDRTQRNFTDPDSRILPTRDGFVQGYNGQIAVDAAHQIIVAHRLVTNAADARALVPLIDDVRAHLGRKPREVSGDAGFANEANLAALKERRITAYLAPGRAHHGEADAAGRRTLTKTPLMRAMAARLNLRAIRHEVLRRFLPLGRAPMPVIAQKAFSEWLRARGLPTGISTKHFINVAGLDQYRAVRGLIIVGRTLPSPMAVEALAGAVIRKDIEKAEPPWLNLRRPT